MTRREEALKNLKEAALSIGYSQEHLKELLDTIKRERYTINEIVNKTEFYKKKYLELKATNDRDRWLASPEGNAWREDKREHVNDLEEERNHLSQNTLAAINKKLPELGITYKATGITSSYVSLQNPSLKNAFYYEINIRYRNHLNDYKDDKSFML